MERPIALCASLFVAAVTGCQTVVVRDSWADFEKQYDPQTWRRSGEQASDTEKADDDEQNRWAIHVSTFTGADRQDRAAKLAAHLRRSLDMSDVWVHDDGRDRTLVYRGRFARPDSDQARNALRQTRMVKIDDRRPFTQAHVVATAVVSEVPIKGPHDLRQFPGLYTLEVEVYDEQIGSTFRDMAEQRVRTLRQDGKPWYFYHGPHYSSVTVGLFTREQAFVWEGATEAYAPLVRQLQREHPLHLRNGHTVVEKFRGRTVGDQKSSLVRISF